VLDEMLLIIGQLFPIFHILGQVDFFGGPERSLLILVHLPNFIVLDWEEDESVWVLFKKRLWQSTLCEVL
jgi:hypothetical protein